MVTIFKKLREKLLRSGQTRKYLIYAIGEIFLVVIGILIALQVNNWNEQRQHDTEVVNYLTNLKGTLNDDIRSLESAASFNKLRLYGIFYILRNADLNTKKFTDFPWADVSANDGRQSSWEGPYPDTLNREFTDLVFSMIGRGFGTGSFNKSVINELYSTGSYSRIHNKVLKQKIAAYYRYLEQRLEGYAIEEHEEWANETTRFFRDQYAIFTLDTTDLQDPFGLIKGKKDAEHHLRYMALEVNYHIVWCLNAKEKAKELIELIEREVSG